MFEHGWTEAKETGTLGPDHQSNMAMQRFDYINYTPVGARPAVTRWLDLIKIIRNLFIITRRNSKCILCSFLSTNRNCRFIHTIKFFHCPSQQIIFHSSFSIVLWTSANWPFSSHLLNSFYFRQIIFLFHYYLTFFVFLVTFPPVLFNTSIYLLRCT